MSETTMATNTADHESLALHADEDHHDAEHHPTEGQYWIVFAILAVLTAIEVAWSYLGLSGPALVVPLIVMMLVKFALVAGAFMHLYFDLRIINGRYFMWTFATSIVLAMTVFAVVFAAFQFEI